MFLIIEKKLVQLLRINLTLGLIKHFCFLIYIDVKHLIC